MLSSHPSFEKLRDPKPEFTKAPTCLETPRHVPDGFVDAASLDTKIASKAGPVDFGELMIKDAAEERESTEPGNR